MFKSIDDIYTLSGKDFSKEDLELLTDKDFDFCKNFHESRREEYLVSRALLQKILKQIGVLHPFIEKGTNREPKWPKKVCGSISHSKGCVLVGISQKYKSIGIDIEHKNRVKENLYRKLFSKKEIEIINKNGVVYADILFSAKEAFYKMQYPLTKQYLDFLDIELDFYNDQLHVSYIAKDIIKLETIKPLIIEEDSELVGCLSLGN